MEGEYQSGVETLEGTKDNSDCSLRGRESPRRFQSVHTHDPTEVIPPHIRDRALSEQPLDVELVRVGVLLDLLVHERLGEHGLVDLIVAVLSVANNVNHHVGLESLKRI